MRCRPTLGVVITVASLAACSNPLGEGDYVGIIANESSHTLKIDDPLDSTKYFRLKPGQKTKDYALPEGRQSFTAYYDTDGRTYGSAVVNIDAIKDDAEYDGQTYDWCVVFVDPGWFGVIEASP